jgi:DedD protein
VVTSLKQRIVGAIFILSLGVILIPLILDNPQEEHHHHLSHVIPEAPPLPDVSDVSKIHYVFNDAVPQAPSQQAAETDNAALIDVAAPTDVFELATAPTETTSEPEPTAPAPEAASVSTALAVNEVAPSTVIIPDLRSETAPRKTTTQIQEKAKASLAQAAQSQWTIQLGAFSSEQNADALMKKLSQQGFTPYVRKIANDSLVRVYVSPGVPRDQAMALVTKLDTELGLKGIVVRYFQ